MAKAKAKYKTASSVPPPCATCKADLVLVGDYRYACPNGHKGEAILNGPEEAKRVQRGKSKPRALRRFIVAYIGECCPRPHLMVVEADTADEALKQMQKAGYDTGDLCTVSDILACAPFKPEED